jgi:SiaC family regulatory phosphoprotein
MSLDIEASVKTPSILMDESQGSISIKGISIPEDPHEFYYPLVKAIEDYQASPAAKTALNLQLEYFNTSSTLILRNVIKELRTIKEKTELVVNWFFESDDEDMKEAGEEFKLLFSDIDFNVTPVESF